MPLRGAPVATATGATLAGGGVVEMATLAVSLPPRPSVTVRIAANEPRAAVDVARQPPGGAATVAERPRVGDASPPFEPVDAAPEKLTVSGAVPLCGEPAATATGGDVRRHATRSRRSRVSGAAVRRR